MRLNILGRNQTEVSGNRATVLFSYNTPVAAQTVNGMIRTRLHHSRTTERHINQWLDGRAAAEVEQEVLDHLAIE